MTSWRRAVAALALSGLLVACTATDLPSPPASTSAPSSTVAVGLPWPALPEVALPAAKGSAMQQELERWVSAGFLPGVTAAVVGPEGTWSGAAGVDGRGVPLEPRSGMALASITKTFVAAEVLLLAEQGEVDLDEPASTYVTSPLVANGTTVRQLLGHRSGLSDSSGEAHFARALSHPNEHLTPRDFLSVVPARSRPAGATWEYANANYLLLGLLLEDVTDVDVGALLRRDLWEPLRLERLAYQDAEKLTPPLAAPGAEEAPSPATHPDPAYVPTRALASLAGAAGGVAGDAESVARWGYALYGALLLRPRSVEQMTDFADGDGYGLATIDFTAGDWYGLNIDAFGHVGETAGYRTILAVFPRQRLSVVLLSPSLAQPDGYVKHLVKAGRLLSP